MLNSATGALFIACLITKVFTSFGSQDVNQQHSNNASSSALLFPKGKPAAKTNQNQEEQNSAQYIRKIKRAVVDSWTIHARSSTINYGDGRKETTVYYFNPRGESFKFTINDELPVSQDEMIDWIEGNKKEFSLTSIPYESQSEQPVIKPDEPEAVPSHHQTPEPAGWEFEDIVPEDDPIIPHRPQCGNIELYVQDKVAFGEEAEIEKTPWQAGIIKRVDGKLLCGGSVITKRHIVTAAHCFRGKIYPDKFRVTVGSDQIENTDMDELYEPQRIYVHGRYDRIHKRNDVALILLKETLIFSNQVYPICLPPLDITYSSGKVCTAGGWGGTEENQETQPLLRTVNLEITGQNYCQSKYEGKHKISSGMFCAEGTNFRRGDTCGGDSGGPLACKEANGFYYLYGITSFGDIGVCEGKPTYSPGVYVYVSRYREWISRHIKKYRNTYVRLMNLNL